MFISFIAPAIESPARVAAPPPPAPAKIPSPTGAKGVKTSAVPITAATATVPFPIATPIF